jgi:hypothetical protein
MVYWVPVLADSQTTSETAAENGRYLLIQRPIGPDKRGSRR